MKSEITRLLTIAYEVEGLLHVLEQHSDTTPAVVLDILRDKANDLAASITTLTAEGHPEATVLQPTSTAVQTTTVVDVPTAADVETETTTQIEEDAEVPADADIDQQGANYPEVTVAPHDTEPTSDERDENELPLRDETDVDREIFGSQGYVEPAKVQQNETTIIVESDAHHSEHREAMRVDEKLHRTLSQDLRKAFSLNDRFRFQRELFAGNATLMNDSLSLVESMSSLAEAEAYFYDKLGWDRDDEIVADFMTVIRHHLE